MANPNASLDIKVEKLELTPQKVSWNGVDLGATLDGVTIEIKYMKGEIKADQYGVTVLDRRLNGTEITVTTALGQVRDPLFWSKVFPSAQYATSGMDKSLTFNQETGRSDRDNAQVLVLHPVVLDDTDVSQDHTFYLAHPSEESSIAYGPEDQSKAELVFNIYPQILTGDGGSLQFYRFGTPTLAPS